MISERKKLKIEMKITHFIIRGGSALIRVLSFLLSLFFCFLSNSLLKNLPPL